MKNPTEEPANQPTRDQLLNTAASYLVERICSCTERIAWNYFQLPIAELEDPRYRERVYCYELYHQLRLGWRDDEQLREFELCGEVDKSGHPLIRGTPYLDRAKPDFLVHVPRTMTKNLLVVEVKPITTSPTDFVTDVNKVAAFLSDGGEYIAAVCLVYGDDPRRFNLLRAAGAAALSTRAPLCQRA